MKGPVFQACFAAVASTSETDVFEIVAPSSGRLRILEVEITQHSEAGDAAAEMLPIRYLRGSTASGGSGSTLACVNLGPGTKVSESSVIGMSTALGSTASTAVAVASAFNVQAGYYERPEITQEYDGSVWLSTGQRCLIRVGAPADSVTFNGRIKYQEMPK